MIEYNIPGFQIVRAEALVLDYNGTIALDGALIPGVREMLNTLAADLEVHVVTADTFGRARAELEGVQCRLAVLEPGDQDARKGRYVAELGAEKTIAIGNGRNDSIMLRDAAIGILVMQGEGASARSLVNSDIVCSSVIDAFEIILNPLRVIATLRS